MVPRKHLTLEYGPSQTDVATLEVTELPIRRWTQDYKEFLESLIKPEAKEVRAVMIPL